MAVLDKRDWQNLMIQFGFANNLECYNTLVEAYSEPHRHYHNQNHICACLQQLSECRKLTHHAHWVEIALWFHDAIYKTRKSDNEQQSAQWAQHFIQTAGGDSTLAQTVYAAIIATQTHQGLEKGSTASWVVDIGLSILGQSEPVYREFEINIRREYYWVPKMLYKYKRKKVLKQFLQRERIYHNDHFHQLLDQQARENLQRAISDLRFL